MCLTVQRSPIAGSKPSVESLRRNVEFYWYAHCGHTNLVSRNGTAQGIGGARVPAMGLSRAISRFNPELRPALRKNGFLTRDSRMKERKKYGQKGARKRFQFTKR